MNEATLPDTQSIDEALGRSVLYSALAVALSPPKKGSLEHVFGPATSAILLDAARVLDRLAQTAELVRLAQESRVEELERAYQRLFGHTARGKVSPYETEYGRERPFGQSQELADINGFYNAFGLSLPKLRHERSDHVAVECEFLSFLICKGAQTLADGDLPSSDAVDRAERLFLREHLGQFGRALGRSLAQEADHRFYQAAGEVLFDFLTAECRHHGIPAGPEFLQLRSTSEMDVPMACSSECSLLRHGPVGRDGVEGR